MKSLIRIDFYGNITGLTGKCETFPVEPVFDTEDKAQRTLYDNAFRYLNPKYREQEVNFTEAAELITEGLNQARALMDFRMVYEVLPLIKDDEGYRISANEPYIKSQSLTNLFNRNHSNQVLITAATLGSQVDERIRLYKVNNPSQMVLLNACSSAYIEYLVDCTERIIAEKSGLKNLSFRFAPGYGDVPLEWQRWIFKLFEKEEKELGITLNENCFMSPIKSMTGITGCIKEN